MLFLPTLLRGSARLKLFLLLLMALGPASLRAQAPAFAWATPCASFNTAVNSSQTSARGPTSMAVDVLGQVYVAGSFTETVTLGTTTLTSSGLSDAFVAKLDASGRYLWAVAVGGAGNDGAAAVAVDALGQAYVTGGFTSYSVDFGSQRLFNSSASSEAFVAALDAQGNWRWAHRAGGTGGESGLSLVVEPDGDLLLAGGFTSAAADFGSTTLTNAGSSVYADVFVARLEGASGAWRWAQRGGGTRSEIVGQLCSDGQGHAWLGGSYSSQPAQFGATALPANPTGRGNLAVADQAFVAEFNTQTGAWTWATHGGAESGPLGGTSDCRVLAFDGMGGLYLAGSFNSATSRFGAHALSNRGPVASNGTFSYYTSEAYVARLDVASRTWSWARRLGSDTYDYLYGIVAGPQGSVVVAGRFEGPALSFDGSPLTLTHATSGYALLAQLDGTTGTWQWARGTAPSEGPFIATLASNAAGELYLAGFYNAPTTLGPTVLQPVAGQYATGFVAKLSSAPLAAHPAQRGPAFAVWPNPAQGEVWLSGLPPGQTVQLHDALGRPLLRARTPGSGPLRLPLALPAGVYLLRSPGYLAQRLLVE
ncbi:T9SS type A sorting domain-containing protein [Hymenobacter aquaticus]|uniref:T9SS type A sorting domain-containing protein n=1 Tax=Hymenobacter aquaticus TaxID=1867101 RepID=A0A4Z0PVM2_9BACT|nr:T9SS type A sorting domain-containing protein [Hymenobacter aquaticus]TGE21788.1 T9SS type A sorting domain-containing protein [Hymenobacter aquaticus]